MNTDVADRCQYPDCDAPAEFKVMGGSSSMRMGSCRAHLSDAVEIIPGIRAGLESADPGTRIVTPLTG